MYVRVSCTFTSLETVKVPDSDPVSVTGRAEMLKDDEIA